MVLVQTLDVFVQQFVQAQKVHDVFEVGNCYRLGNRVGRGTFDEGNVVFVVCQLGDAVDGFDDALRDARLAKPFEGPALVGVVSDYIVQHGGHPCFIVVHPQHHAQRMQDVRCAALVRLVGGMGMGSDLDRQGQWMKRRASLQFFKPGEQGIELGGERRGFKSQAAIA